MSVVIETTYGDITVDLFTEERPIACLNFIKLCKLKYYNFNLFHTVERGFIAQTGDPTGAGDGGSSVWGVLEGIHKRFFEAEYLPKIYHSSAGLLSLVSAGKNLVGSQFFFTLGADLTSLDGVHCVIGEVVEGEEILRKLNEAIVDEKFRPYQDIRITHTVVLNDPFPDPRGFQVPNRSPSPSAERMQNGRIAADEDIDDTGGKTLEEIQEMLAEREAKARATILEIVGDLPDADMAPPENVLFVCKLNPVTTDDDLEIIFSRFGKVQNCEVIRDRKSGDSLQYAFVEFEDQKSCEAAYFKMDNVLIDDRRIHVDFSQSVSKVKWRGKGRGVEGPDGRIDFNNLKDSGKKEQRGGRRNESRERSRDRMTSEERRRAREARHKEQELVRSKNRSRSKSRNRGQYDDRRRSEYGGESNRNRRTEDRRDNSNKSRYYSRNQNSQRRRYSRSRSPERGGRRYVDKGNSPERRRDFHDDRQRSPDRRRRSPEKRRDFADVRRSPDRRRRSPERRRNSPDRSNTVDRRRQFEPSTEEQKNGNGKSNKLKRKKDEKQKKTKKSKKHASSDDNSSSSNDTDSEEDEDSTSESSSSDVSTASRSEDERNKKKKKKSKKTKKHKKTKSKKKSKKHKK